jgi:hypothetical protein
VTPTAALLRRATIDQEIDRARLGGMLAKYGAETIVQWIGELARKRGGR